MFLSIWKYVLETITEKIDSKINIQNIDIQSDLSTY